MIEDAALAPILLQQADEAYRSAPDAPDCGGITTSWLWQQEQHPPPRAMSTTSSASSITDSEETETTSWANFPVCMRTEQHPSMLSLDLYLEEQEEAHEEEAPESETEGPDDADFFIAPEQLLKLNRIISFTEAPSHTSTTTFGWGDFPIVAQQLVTPSFDYPWRYHKADEDQEIVPLAAPVHLKTSTVMEVTPSTTTTITTTTASSIPPSPSHDDPRTVSFGNVRIREYRECLGDHPWCPQYPVSLDWSYDPRETVVDVDVYEEQARETCCWSSTPRRMEVLERRCRLARAMRVTKAEIDVLETHRQERVQQADEEGMARGEGSGDGDSTVMTPTTALLHRIPTMIVLPQDKFRNSSNNKPSVCFLELEAADD